jgi:uncharacterized membrane protein YfcA
LTWSLTPAETAWCAAAIALAYAVRAISGFGAGVIATPLLTFVLPLPVTVPLITVIGMFAGSRQVVRDWRIIEWRRIAIFVPGSLVGVALGLYLFTALDPVLLARALGVYVRRVVDPEGGPPLLRVLGPVRRANVAEVAA